MRTCDGCSACCVYPEIPVLQKAAGERCKFLNACGRCEVYDMRPPMCRSYSCAWLEGHGGEGDQPDKIHALIDRRETQFGMVLVARALKPGACQTKQVRKAIKRMSRDLDMVCLVVSDDINDNQRVKQIIGARKPLTNFRRQFPAVNLYDDGTAKQKVV